jgi:hypothetical protein
MYEEMKRSKKEREKETVVAAVKETSVKKSAEKITTVAAAAKMPR